MNIVFGAIMVVLGVIVANSLSQKYVERRKFFENFNSFNDRLKTEVSFSQRTILSLIEEYKNEESLFYDYLMMHFSNKEFKRNKNYLTKDEIDFLMAYLQTIGTTDKNTQLKYLEMVAVETNQILKKSKEEELKYKSLYIKLGFLIGIAIMIILL